MLTRQDIKKYETFISDLRKKRERILGEKATLETQAAAERKARAEQNANAEKLQRAKEQQVMQKLATDKQVEEERSNVVREAMKQLCAHHSPITQDLALRPCQCPEPPSARCLCVAGSTTTCRWTRSTWTRWMARSKRFSRPSPARRRSRVSRT